VSNNPRVVRDRRDLLTMLRCQLEEFPHQATQVAPLIAQIEAHPTLGEDLVRRMAATSDWRPATGEGFFNLQALSTLPFVAITQLQLQLPSLLRRVKIYGEQIGDVRIVVTPHDEVYAKATAGTCELSLGFLNIVYCTCVYLFVLGEEMHTTGEWIMARAVPKYRNDLCRLLALHVREDAAREFVESNFRDAHYQPFVESNDVLQKLGIVGATIDACLTQGEPTAVLTALLMANLCLRFIALHELAHYHYGHTQFLQLWADEALARQVLKCQELSADARRAMESYADVWATEMLLITEVFSDSSIIQDNLVAERRAPPATRTRCALVAAELMFHILLGIDSVTSGTNAMTEDLRSALQGRVDTMYPGAISRAAYAVRRGARRAAANHPYLRWTRWWRMKQDMPVIIEMCEPVAAAIFGLWHACALGGMLPVKRGAYEYSPRIKLSSHTDRGPTETWRPSDRFDYIAAHQELTDDLERAKRWAKGRERAHDREDSD
jgi:hypothetical protein